ncbi:MAG: MBL fold metallo-hydrolase [Anaerolineales bacterium]|nr:MBL fold metallo-hydrolase [Anaerolineales bacterium]
MKITFHGAAQTVTGSRHLLEVNGRRLLLDCGLYQGAREEAKIRNRDLRFDPATLDAVILSHAHIDHSGNIPSLPKLGYHGPIYATPATHDLCEYMLKDSARIQESDVEFFNKKAAQKGEPATAEALYTEEDAVAALELFRPRPLNQPFEVLPGVQATFYEAGHMLGSAMLVLDVEERGGRKFRFAFSGDIGRQGLPILRDPTFLQDVDYCIMESTYGTKTHRPPSEASVEFRQMVKETVARGGKIIVPAFAVGRSQEIVFELHKMIEEREIPAIPVFVDSPLAVNASDVYQQHEDLFDEETQKLLRKGDVFGFSSLKYTRSVDESKAINDVRGSCVIISASGMAENGRILHHLKNNIENPRNTILIVSWQAPHTLGRRLAEREPEVKIFGEWYNLRANVATINGMSGHAGRDLLVQWASALKPRVKNIFLVHGEPESSAALKTALETEAGLSGVHAPALHESVEV